MFHQRLKKFLASVETILYSTSRDLKRGIAERQLPPWILMRKLSKRSRVGPTLRKPRINGIKH